MSWDPESFAASLLAELRRHDPAAAVLVARHRGRTATIGVADEGGFVPLLRLGNPSGACNVMSLDVRHHERWAPTFERGTPAMLAATLLGPLRFTWAVWAEDVAWSDTSDHVH
jgi:hypothetical protein